MSDTLAGLTRRVKTFAFERDTAATMREIVSEAAEVGSEAADAIVEIGLAGTGLREGTSLTWSYGSADAEGVHPMVSDDAPASVVSDYLDDEESDPYDGTWTDPEAEGDSSDKEETDAEEAEGEEDEAEGSPMFEDVDHDEIDRGLESLALIVEHGVGNNELAEATLLPGEVKVY